MEILFKRASPAVAIPTSEITAAVAELASQKYSYEGNWQEAKSVASPFGRQSVPSILAAMVHPPAIRDAIPAWVWLPRVQLAAAQVAAQIEMEAGVSLEHSLLAEIVRGPIDWTIDAAVIALVQRARMQTNLSASVRLLFKQLLERVPRQGYWSCIETTMRNWLLLPDVPEMERLEIERMIAECEAA